MYAFYMLPYKLVTMRAFVSLHVIPDSEDVGRTETCDSDTDNEAEVGTDTTDLEDLFEEMSDKAEQTDGSYFPFPSKIFALLYLLLNSPHPMVIV